MTDYADLMTAIIKKQITIIGAELALKLARSVNGIEVSDAGVVTTGASKDKLRALLEAYKQVAGEVSVMFAKKASPSLKL